MRVVFQIEHVSKQSGKGFSKATDSQKPTSNKPLKYNKKGLSVDQSVGRKSKIDNSPKNLEHTIDSIEKKLQKLEQGTTAQQVSAAFDGRVDYVQVKDWGIGQPEDLENLEIASPIESYVNEESFYDSLARQLQAFQQEGLFEVARPKGAPPMPQFSSWIFAQEHYVQYLVDLLCVHRAIEEACEVENSTSNSTNSLAHHFTALFGPNKALTRSIYIEKDINGLLNTKPFHQNDQQDKNRLGQASSVPPSPNAEAYARHLQQLLINLKRSETDEEYSAILLKLIAHAYVIILTFLTSGTRVGAAATEKLNLFNRGAVAFYTEYTGLELSPLTTFKSAVEAMGSELTRAQQEVFVAELPTAMRRVGMLLEPLARDKVSTRNETR